MPKKIESYHVRELLTLPPNERLEKINQHIEIIKTRATNNISELIGYKIPLDIHMVEAFVEDIIAAAVLQVTALQLEAIIKPKES